MLKEALQYLHGLKQPHVVALDGEPPFVDGELHPPPSIHAAPVELSTLTSLVSYAGENRDALTLADLTAAVRSPTSVHLFGSPDEYGRRPKHAVVDASIPQFRFNAFLDRQEFHIGLLAMFVATAERDELLKLVGNLEAGETRTVSDDGVSQQVVVATNLASKAREVVRPLFRLAPFSTFAEVEQVERAFIFRLLDKDGRVLCGLFEADGGAWKNVACQRVAAFLTNGLKPLNVATLW